jgi:class 3 adenylate cyclase
MATTQKDPVDAQRKQSISPAFEVRNNPDPLPGKGRETKTHSRFRIPIFVKLAALSTLLIALIISVITYFILKKQKEQFGAELMNLGANMTRIVANNSADKLLGQEELELFRLVKDISENAHVQYALVTDRNNLIKAHTDIERVNKPYTPPPGLLFFKSKEKVQIGSFFQNGEAVFFFEQPITYQNLEVGKVHLAISQATILKSIQNARSFIFVLTIIIVAIGILLSIAFSIYFSRPIRKLQETAKILADGNFQHRVSVKRNDELGDLASAFNDMAEGLSERETIRETFGKYVTPEIRDEILSGRIPLDGESRTATVLFSDLRDFTPYVEESSPEEVIQGLRSYFTEMEKAIRINGGLVLQYIGDEIEAVFGVPLACEDHAQKAVTAALDMRACLKKLNEIRIHEGLRKFRHGIGVHTGEVLAGNSGSQNRLSYTLIGDTVNLTSRLQGLTKKFKCDILVSEETVKYLIGSFDLEREDPQMVKGYSKPITIYRVIE